MTPEQEHTLAWMRRTRPAAMEARGVILVYLAVNGDPDAVIFPDGSYSTTRLGQRHDQPRRRVV